MCAVRLSMKRYSTLLDQAQGATSASASGTGAKSTVTTSQNPSGVKQGSSLENQLLFQIRAARLPEPVREARFIDGRRWRADFAWPDKLLIVEVEGGTWTNGRHTRGKGFESDCEKYNEAALAGWRVIRVTGSHIKSGVAIQLIERAFT